MRLEIPSYKLLTSAFLLSLNSSGTHLPSAFSVRLALYFLPSSSGSSRRFRAYFSLSRFKEPLLRSEAVGIVMGLRFSFIRDRYLSCSATPPQQPLTTTLSALQDDIAITKLKKSGSEFDSYLAITYSKSSADMPKSAAHMPTRVMASCCCDSKRIRACCNDCFVSVLGTWSRISMFS